MSEEEMRGSGKYGSLQTMVDRAFDRCAAIMEGILGSDEFERDAYNLTHEMSWMWSTMTMTTDDLSVQAFHTDLSGDHLDYLRKLGHYLFLGFVPLTEDGMWLRLLPVPSMKEVRVPNPTKKKKRREGEEDEVWVWQLDMDEKAEWAHKNVKYIYRGAPEEDDNIRPLKEGVFAFVPKGTMFLCPASLLHGGDMRTGARGNERAHFAFYFERKAAAKTIAEALLVGYDRQEFRNDYITGHQTANRPLLVDAFAKVKANNDQVEEHYRNSGRKAPAPSKKARATKRNAEDTEEWVTDELRQFANVFFV